MRFWIPAVAVLSLGATTLSAQPTPGRLSTEGVTRAAAQVDSVFVDRTAPSARIDAGDWASYLLARLGSGKIPDSLSIEVLIDSAHIEVRGRMRDLPQETRDLLGPIASMVDSNTVIVADVLGQRTGREVFRFWLRGLKLNGRTFPEFLLSTMMAQVGRQYPALTASGRDLYVQVPPDAVVRLGDGVVEISVPAGTSPARSTRPPE